MNHHRPPATGPRAAPMHGGQPEGSRSWVWTTNLSLADIFAAEQGPRPLTNAEVLPFPRNPGRAPAARQQSIFWRP
jgi:hypothetical protein